MTVYRVPWAKAGDMKKLCKLLNNLLDQHKKIISVGEFNILSFGNEDELQVHYPFIHGTTEHNLIQLSCVATRYDSFLDLVFVSPHFMNSVITNVAPIAGLDHEGQLCKIHDSLNRSRHTTWKTLTHTTLF